MQRGFSPVLIVILIAAALGGYFVFSNKTASLNITPKPTPPARACSPDTKMCSDGSTVSRVPPNCDFAPCSSPESSQSADISNWKTYTNTKYGFSFKYPPDLIAKESKKDPSTTLIINPKSSYPSVDISVGGEELIWINVQVNNDNLAPQQLIDKHITETYKDTSNETEKYMNNFNIKEIRESLKVYKNNEIAGLYYIEGSDNVWVRIIQTKNNKIFRFGYEYWSTQDKVGKQHEDFMYQILSTFKFLP